MFATKVSIVLHRWKTTTSSTLNLIRTALISESWDSSLKKFVTINLHGGKNFSTFENSGFLTHQEREASKCTITGYDLFGFEIGDIYIQGSIIVFPSLFFLWKPQVFEDITVDSLDLVTRVWPKIDILYLGVGERCSRKICSDLLDHFSKKGITVEQMDSKNAASTFNILNSEDRMVAAALLPMNSQVPPEGYYS